jgi:hypothetical protein
VAKSATFAALDLGDGTLAPTDRAEVLATALRTLKSLGDAWMKQVRAGIAAEVVGDVTAGSTRPAGFGSARCTLARASRLASFTGSTPVAC